MYVSGAPGSEPSREYVGEPHRRARRWPASQGINLDPAHPIGAILCSVKERANVRDGPESGRVMDIVAREREGHGRGSGGRRAATVRPRRCW